MPINSEAPVIKVHVSFARSVGPFTAYVLSYTPVEIQSVHSDDYQVALRGIFNQLKAAGATIGTRVEVSTGLRFA